MRRKSGVETQVRFDSGDNLWVRTDELEWERASSESESRHTERRMPSVHFVERKVVEALRLGIVPDEGFQLFTVGRDAEIDDFRGWLERAGEPSRLLIGSYGTGKTHLLNFFRLLALDAGYAVSLVEMDPQETPFSKPKRVYSQIVRNLQWKDGSRTRDFRALLERALQQGYLSDHKYFQHLRTGDPRLWAWIDGSDSGIRPYSADGEFRDLPALYAYTTAANIYCYLLSGLGWVCQRRDVGLKGLLVLFDESEALYAMRSQSMLDRSVNFLDTLIVTASDDEDMLNPAHDSDYEFAYHAREIPFLYKQPSGLKLLFAFTSVWDLHISQELTHLPRMGLAPLTTDQITGMLVQVIQVYDAAYSARDRQTDLDEVQKMMLGVNLTSTRDLVKSLIEAMDISRLGTYAPDDEW